MGNRQTLPLLLVAALLAGGAYFWLDDGGRRPVAPEPGAGPAPQATPAAKPTPLAEPGVAATPANAPEEARRVVVEAPPGSRAPGLARGPREGRVRVLGSVTESAGRPLAGARIRATGGLVGLDVLGDTDWLDAYEAVTDEQGRFVLEDVEPGVLQLVARSPGFAPYRRDKIGIPREPEVRLDPCVLQPGATLTGIVVDPAGRGVPGAEIHDRPSNGVTFFGLGNQRPLAVTDAVGAFRIDELAIGPWRFQVHSEDHPDLLVSGVTERGAPQQAGLRWQLEPGATITGQVTGVPAGEREVLEVRASRAERNLDRIDLDGLVGSTRVGEVGSSGRFELRGLDVGGRYELQARRKREAGRMDLWERSRSASVEATAGDSGVVLSYQPEGAVLLTVVDASSGDPIEELQVEAGIDWPMAVRDEDGRPRRRFPEGRVRAGGLRPDSSEDRVSLVVKATGYRDYRRDDIALRAGQELDLGVLRLDPVPVLRVQVLDATDRKPVARASVRITRDTGDRQSIQRTMEFGADGLEDAVEFGDGRSAVTDENGWAEITSFEGETVVLKARAKGYAPLEQPGIFLPAGQRVEQQVLLGRGGEALVQVVDARGMPQSGVRVAHREPGAPGLRFGMPGSDHVTDSQGQVLFETLQAGLHSFRIDDGQSNDSFFASEDQVVISGFGGDAGDDWSELQVAEGERAELRLVAAPRGDLTGRVREGGQALAGAALELRDPEQEPGPGLMLGGPQGPRGTSDGSGHYRIADVKAGRYLLSVTHPGRQMPEEYPLEIREGDNAFDVDLPLSILEGRVTDEQGAPLAGVRVWPERAASDGPPRARFAMIMIEDSGGGGSVIHSGQEGAKPVLTDQEGRYALRGVTSGVDLVVKAEGDTVQPGQSDKVQVAPDEVRDNVDLALEAGGAIDVVAEAADGSPARMCIVQASYGGEADSGVQPKFSFIQSGSTMLKGLKPGPWKVSVRRAGPGDMNEDSGQEQVIEVEAGETVEASFRLP